ncbi:deoxyguanosinetriphosphate triphosphohydrolase [Litoribacillus peritrichatus]|uniref:Deoxyguanosinetriphosphate triphosphohydrolase n=1 Tax=Litoribacillus peritrichatus TaxID=718191 RepID=A0ABP7MQV0_9GAMM
MTMKWESLLSRERLGKLAITEAELARSPFHKDHDRIVFSGAFRRLGKKTQVHPVDENDHVHTRLTHSLEVGCVGRSLGTRVGEYLSEATPEWVQPDDIGVIVQAACLAHDIGNPPFGHSGEDAIRHWFHEADEKGMLTELSEAEKNDLLNFEGNAQGLRILTQLEYHLFDGGMRLTYATLGAYLKYPWTSLCLENNPANKGKYGCNQSELEIMKAIADKLGLIQLSDDTWCRHPLVYLMEAADDICYALLDLEDGLEMNILPYDEIEQLMFDLLQGDIPETYRKINDTGTGRRKLSMLRGKAIDHLVSATAKTFIEKQDDILNGRLQGDLVDHLPERAKTCVLAAKNMAKERIFNSRNKTLLEVGAYSVLEELMSAFCGAVHQFNQGQGLSYKNKRIIDLMEYRAPQEDWSLYQCYMRVIDFIAGMTDRYAITMAQQISGRPLG